MQLLRGETNSGANGGGVSGDECARHVLDVTPPTIRAIRQLMRSHRLRGLSVPQFRAMARLSWLPKASLSNVAEHVGCSLPAASRMIDVLVAQKLVVRHQCSNDRRQVSLGLTAREASAFLDFAAGDADTTGAADGIAFAGTEKIGGGGNDLPGGDFGTDADRIVTDNLKCETEAVPRVYRLAGSQRRLCKEKGQVMWIVRLALRRPYTFVVAAMLVVILGVVFILRMPTDIFPEIDIPVVAVAFQYGGMTPDDMEQRMVTNFEGFLVTTVNDIEHVESQSLNGVGVIKVYFYPGAKIEQAIAQVTSIAQTAIRSMPPGSTPPLIIRYNASDVPILQLALGSDTLNEQQVFDSAINFVRNGLVTIQGIEIPFPYGGRQRQIMVDLDPQKLYAWGISASDVSAAIGSQNLVLPVGNEQDRQAGICDSPELQPDGGADAQ